MKKQNVLILAYYFPPFAGVASQRSSKFCKYLPEYDWVPIIFTVDSRYYANRIVSPESNSAAANTVNATNVKRIRYIDSPLASILIKLLYPLLALVYIVRHRKELDAVYFSGSPYHPFLLTTIVTGLLRIPSVIDFRDSWSINHGYDGKKLTNWRSKIKEKSFQFIESLSMRFASQVVFATRKLQAEYTELFPYWSYKFSTIHNGYDPADIATVNVQRKFSGTTLVMAGKMYLYTPEVVDVLMEVLQISPDLFFLYIGEEHSIIQEAAHRYRVESQVKILPFQPHSKVLDLMAGADIGLVTNGMVNGLGTKIFEYLALGKPTICLVPEGSIIAQEFGVTPSVLISHPPYTVATIKHLLLSASKQVNRPPEADLNRFNRKNSTKNLADILNTITYK